MPEETKSRPTGRQNGWVAEVSHLERGLLGDNGDIRDIRPAKGSGISIRTIGGPGIYLIITLPTAATTLHLALPDPPSSATTHRLLCLFHAHPPTALPSSFSGWATIKKSLRAFLCCTRNQTRREEGERSCVARVSSIQVEVLKRGVRGDHKIWLFHPCSVLFLLGW